MSVILHLHKSPLKLAVGILIPVVAFATVEREMVDARDILIICTAQKLIITLESVDYFCNTSSLSTSCPTI